MTAISDSTLALQTPSAQVSAASDLGSPSAQASEAATASGTPSAETSGAVVGSGTPSAQTSEAVIGSAPASAQASATDLELAVARAERAEEVNLVDECIFVTIMVCLHRIQIPKFSQVGKADIRHLLLDCRCSKSFRDKLKSRLTSLGYYISQHYLARNSGVSAALNDYLPDTDLLSSL
ncbi:uncharacterized protein LOC135392305 [Ornithodoros turicata]|uniref:uncharacterized protein LOC135392305 n=1 Tax=Ornithodoros turicata TaxID=34597 RepID=UPI00313953E0